VEGLGGGGEEGGGQGELGGGEEVGEAFEDGHLVDEFVDVGNVGGGGQADAREETVAQWGGFGCQRRRRCGGH